MVIASAVLWGLYGSFVTVLTSMGLSQNALVFLRMFATSIPVALLMLATDRSAFRVRPADIPLFIANGVLSLLFFTFCYTSAIKVTKIATAAALLYTAPAIVMVLSAILFKEQLTARKVFCCLLAAGLGYALYSIFSRIILNCGYSVYTNVCYSFGIAMISFFILACADGSVIQVIESPSRTALGLLCGILTGSMAYVLYTAGMKGMETSRAAQLTTIEPVTAAILGSVLFHQPLSVWEIAGIAMVVGSVIMMNAGTKAFSN